MHRGKERLELAELPPAQGPHDLQPLHGREAVPERRADDLRRRLAVEIKSVAVAAGAGAAPGAKASGRRDGREGGVALGGAVAVAADQWANARVAVPLPLEDVVDDGWDP